MPTTTIPSPRDALLCPSSQPEVEGARVLGVVQPTAGGHEVAYLDQRLEVSPEVLAMAGEANPTSVFRFAARCQTGCCPHFDGSDCQLATRIVQIMPVAVEILPRCQIRSECRWFRQEGAAACRRCPQISTLNVDDSEAMRRVVNPSFERLEPLGE